MLEIVSSGGTVCVQPVSKSRGGRGMAWRCGCMVVWLIDYLRYEREKMLVSECQSEPLTKQAATRAKRA